MRLNSIIATIISFLILLSCSNSVYGQKPYKINHDSIEVSKRLNSFLYAFMSLEFEKFMCFFDSNATAFFPPSAKSPARANNKNEIAIIFKKVFDHSRKLRSAPRYLEIQPNNLMIQLFNSFAIVTFHLQDPDLFGRRTIVLKKVKGKWLIIHLHSSGVPTAK